MLRRIRGVLVTALLWALVWIPVGAVVGLVQWRRGEIFDVFPTPPGAVLEAITRFALQWGILGGINGALFAIVLALAERHRSVGTLSVGRVALWGGVGTVVLPACILLIALFTFPLADLSVQVFPLMSIVALGALCGAAMLLFARRFSPDERP